MWNVKWNRLFFQADDDEFDAFLSDLFARGTDGAFVFPHVDFYDVQRLALHSRDIRSVGGVFSVWLEEISDCGRNRTLPLMFKKISRLEE